MPAKGCRNRAPCRLCDGRWKAPSSTSNGRSADVARAVVRSWRSLAALTVLRPRRGGSAIATDLSPIYVVETASATAKCRKLAREFIARGFTRANIYEANVALSKDRI